MHGLFIIFIFLPTVALAYVILTLFYDYAKAYIALCWVPVTLFLFIGLLGKFEAVWRKPGNLSENLTEAVVWISLLQFLFGIGLAGYAISKKQKIFFLLIASFLVVIPFIWRIIN
jgi:hypothetical protein